MVKIAASVMGFLCALTEIQCIDHAPQSMNDPHLRMAHSTREPIRSPKDDQNLSRITNDLRKGQSREPGAKGMTNTPMMHSIFSRWMYSRKKPTASRYPVKIRKKKTKAPKDVKTKSAIGIKFAQQSFVEGMFHEETPGMINIVNDDGLNFEVSANLTTRREGIVSLADAADLIYFVTCVNPSMIKVTFKNNLDNNEALESMFPIGAILIVKADLFGSCMENSAFSNASAIGFNQKLSRLVSSEGNGYLIISTLTQDSQNTVTISGSRGTFFDMFDQGNVQFQAIEDNRRRDLLERVHQYEHKLAFFEKALTVALKMKIIERNGIKSGNFDFGWWGFEFNVVFAIENKFVLDAEIYISKLVVNKTTSKVNLLSTLLSPPPLKLLSMAQKAGVFDRIGKMPDLKLGVYLELITFLDIESSLVYPIGPAISTTATLGKKEVSVDAVFKPMNLQANIQATVVKDEKPDFDAIMKFNYGNEPEVRFKMFWTFQPQVVLYLTDICLAGYGYPFGPELALKARREGIFTPLQQEIGGPNLVGTCDTCYKIDGTLDAVVQSPFFAFVFKDYLNKIIKSPGWTDRRSLLRMCFIGTSCCSASSQPCCGNLVDPCCGGNPDPLVQCCLNSHCQVEKGFICDNNQCICNHECCSDEACGDASLFRCVDNICRTRQCNTTSGTVPCCRGDPMVQCCLNSDCEDEKGFICKDNQCICDQECCSDENCGDSSLYSCVEHICRSKECNITSGIVQCCVNSDCISGRVCQDNTCISKGNPRFTLSWYGDDDLDLHVRTPSNFEIYFSQPFDASSNGQLDHDDIPGPIQRWTESIFFPMDGSAPNGTYQYFVHNYRQVGEFDNWTLAVYLNEQRMNFHSGGMPTVFTFDQN